jgi:ribosome maturation factor RimP
MDRFSSATLRPHIEPLVHAMGLDLEEIEVSRAGRRSVVRIIVDVDGGISLDQIADLTHAVSERIDAEPDFGDQAFTLEVSSPGVDRPLTLPRHWRRNIGRLVSITDEAGVKVQGRILSADESGATVEIKGAPTTFEYAAVKKARIEIEFKREGDDA